MQFAEVFIMLKRILEPYSSNLVVQDDDHANYFLYTNYIMKNKKPLFFAAVQVKKNYVSFYLMPVYVNPELLEGIPEGLRKRMQGKSCFNFRSVDPLLLDELARLTQQGYLDYQARGYVQAGQ